MIKYVRTCVCACVRVDYVVDIDFDYVKPSYFMSLASKLLPRRYFVISLFRSHICVFRKTKRCMRGERARSFDA